MAQSIETKAAGPSKTVIIEKPEKAFKDFLATKGFRTTNQRLAIFDAAFAYKEHFTAEELLDSARNLDASVSRATIYRTLPLLVESALVREVDIGQDFKYYTAVKEVKTFQAQVICAETNNIYEVDAPFMEWYGKAVSEKLGMEPISQRLQVIARPISKTGANTSKPSSPSKH